MYIPSSTNLSAILLFLNGCHASKMNIHSDERNSNAYIVIINKELKWILECIQVDIS